MKLMTLIAACALSFSVMAGNGFDEPKPKNKDKYCAKLKDGKITVFHEGNTITGTVTLSNGTQIMTDGTVMKKDGTKSMLKDGECVTKDGTIVTKTK